MDESFIWDISWHFIPVVDLISDAKSKCHELDQLQVSQSVLHSLCHRPQLIVHWIALLICYHLPWTGSSKPMVTRSACTTNERGAPFTHIPSHLQECWWLLVKVLSIAKTLERHWNLETFSRWSAGEYEVSGRPIKMVLDNSVLRGNALIDASTLGVIRLCSRRNQEPDPGHPRIQAQPRGLSSTPNSKNDIDSEF